MTPNIITEGSVRLVDPNPTGQNVNQEDLFIYAKLTANPKSRTLLTSTGSSSKVTVAASKLKNVKEQTNFTYPTDDKYLTTEWTRLGGKDGLTPGEDVGTLGITSINVDINASYVPVVTVNMVDIRGATLFEQGPCSPYASFFHMPYPVFTLTLKGYYGKAVSYTLGLRKFNTKFNSSTGNFEITCEFIGYTYAFLADIVMGYAMASYRMRGIGSEDKIKKIWEEIRTNTDIYPLNEPNELPPEPISLFKLVKDARVLENLVGSLKNSSEFVNLEKLNVLSESINELNDLIFDYQKEVDNLGTINQTSGYNNSKTKIAYPKNASSTTLSDGSQIDFDDTILEQIKEKTKEYFGDDADVNSIGKYKTKFNTINSSDIFTDNAITKISDFTKTLKDNQSGIYISTIKSGAKEHYIDLGYLYSDNDAVLQELELKIQAERDRTKDIINDAIIEKLGYNPTIRNVFSIIMANVELFLKLLLETSKDADLYHETNNVSDENLLNDGSGNKNIYSWPTYYEQKKSSVGGQTLNGDKRTYPGTRIEFRSWPEIQFVEEFLKAYTELEEELAIITGDVADKPCFDNYIPLNPIESPAFDDIGIDTIPNPNQYFQKTDIKSIRSLIGDRAFLFGDNTLANGLSIWKSRYMLYNDNTGSDNNNIKSLSSLATDLSNRHDGKQVGNVAFNSTTVSKLMRQYGYIDGINAVTSTESIDLLNMLKSLADQTTSISPDIIKDNGSIETITFKEWVTRYGKGLSESQVKTQLQKVVKGRPDKEYYNNIDNEKIIVLNKDIEFYGGESDLKLKPNPNDQSKLETFLIVEEDIFEETYRSGGIKLEDEELKEIVQAAPNTNPYGIYNHNSNYNVYKWLNNTEKKHYGIDTFLNARTFWGIKWSDSINASDGLHKSALSLNESTQIPSTPSDESNNRFYRRLFVNNYDDEIKTSQKDINEDIGKIGRFTKKSGFQIKGVDFGLGSTYTDSGGVTSTIEGGVWSVGGGSADDSLTQTPLWGKNLLNTEQYKFARGLGENKGYERVPSVKKEGWAAPIPIMGEQTDKKTSIRTLAYLTLISLSNAVEYFGGSTPTKQFQINNTYSGMRAGTSHPTNLYAEYFGVSTLLDFANPLAVSTILRTQAGQHTVPKAFVLTLGAVLWRMSESGYLDDIPSTNQDPLIWYDRGLADYIPSLSPYKKLEPYHWPYVIKDFTNKNNKNTYLDYVIVNKSFALIRNDSELEYLDMRKYMKTLIHLPKVIKQQFIDTFINWSDNQFGDDYLPIVDPINFDSGTNPKIGVDKGGLFNNVVGILEYGNQGLTKLHEELYLKNYIISYTSPKIFYGIHKDDYNTVFSLRENEFLNFVEGWREGVKASVDKRISKLSKDANALLNDKKSSSLDDDDIKLSLYNSFQSINEKWITSSEVGSDPVMFYNLPEKNNKRTRTLLDHFRFVDRGMTDIGNKAVIDVTQLNGLATNKSQSLYQLITTLISKNNFDFHALPSFIDFGSNGVTDDELKKMFIPITTLDEVESSPSFICMFIGGTSKSLDIVTKKAYCDANNEVTYKYQDDGVHFKRIKEDKSSIPDDLLDGKTVTAFLVKYGSENQSHFTSINLDQAEFKETQESLTVLDQIAKGGDKSSRSAKGQNLFDIYQTRSYTCEVEGFGNVMIQPMSYFELDNVPMFQGLYLITKVNHTVEPNNVKTKFTGVRVPRVTIPIVTEAYTAMNISDTELSKKDVPKTSEVLEKFGLKNTATTTSNTGAAKTVKLQNQISVLIQKNGGSNGNVNDKNLKSNNPINLVQTYPNNLERLKSGGLVKYEGCGSDRCKFMVKEAGDAFKKMIEDLDSYMKSNQTTYTDRKYLISSMYRTIETQNKLCAKRNANNKCLTSSGNLAAEPGSSNHGWGLAVDFYWTDESGNKIRPSGCDGDRPELAPQYTWLFQNAPNYGFSQEAGLRNGTRNDEVWHWVYFGTQITDYMNKNPQSKCCGKVDLQWDSTKHKLDPIVKNPIDIDTGKQAVLS